MNAGIFMGKRRTERIIYPITTSEHKLVLICYLNIYLVVKYV